MNTVDLFTIFESINKDVIQISYRWKIYLQLFDSGEENLNLLNTIGSNVFSILQKLIVDDTILALSRLTDKVGLPGKENASIGNFLNMARPSLRETSLSELSNAYNKLISHSEHMRTYRNELVAHKDKKHVLGAKQFAGVRYEEIENSIEEIHNIMSMFWEYLFGYQTSSQVICQFGHDGTGLLNALKKYSG